MNEISTIENLVLYLFNETEMTDSVLIQREIDHDPEVECEFENIKRAMSLLDRVISNPSEKCINNIMAYAMAEN